MLVVTKTEEEQNKASNINMYVKGAMSKKKSIIAYYEYF